MKVKAHIAFDVMALGEGNGATFQYINEEEREEDVFLKIFGHNEDQFHNLWHCEFCGTPVTHVKKRLKDRWEEDICELKWCEHCRFRVMHAFANDKPDFETWHNVYVASKARSFEVDLPAECSSELAMFFRRYPNRLNQMTPQAFERFVADVFRANYEAADVVHVGKPGDGGTDVLFVESSGREWLIQAKLRQRLSAVEGFSTVQNLAGTLLIEGKLNGIIVSTADHFSTVAWDAVHRLKKKRRTIKLYDRGVLDRMLEPLLPLTPWEVAIREFSPRVIQFVAEAVTEARAKGATEHQHAADGSARRR